MSSSDVRSAFPPRFVSFAWRYHRCARFRSPPPRARGDGAWALGLRPGHPPLFAMERTGPPRFLGNPCACAPRSSTPGGGPPRQATLRRFGTAAAQKTTAAPTFTFIFEALSRGPHAPCVRFAAGVTPEPRNTRFRLVASLCRAGLSRRVPLCGFGHVFTRLPPHPGLAWRTFRGSVGSPRVRAGVAATVNQAVMRWPAPEGALHGRGSAVRIHPGPHGDRGSTASIPCSWPCDSALEPQPG
jgi:hypothetical protein